MSALHPCKTKILEGYMNKHMRFASVSMKQKLCPLEPSLTQSSGPWPFHKFTPWQKHSGHPELSDSLTDLTSLNFCLIFCFPNSELGCASLARAVAVAKWETSLSGQGRHGWRFACERCGGLKTTVSLPPVALGDELKLRTYDLCSNKECPSRSCRLSLIVNWKSKLPNNTISQYHTI